MESVVESHQDGSVTDSVTDSESIQLQAHNSQIQIPTIAQHLLPIETTSDERSLTGNADSVSLSTEIA